jgi:hypothetical protein
VGPPIDFEHDLELPVWAGVVPLSIEPGAPEADDHVPEAAEAPLAAARFERPATS